MNRNSLRTPYVNQAFELVLHEVLITNRVSVSFHPNKAWGHLTLIKANLDFLDFSLLSGFLFPFTRFSMNIN